MKRESKIESGEARRISRKEFKQDPKRYLSLYVVTDRKLSLGRTEEEVIEAAIRGGATAVQLRAKDLADDEFVGVAKRLRDLTGRFGVLYIVNDRVDIALAVGADGAHVGQEDLPACRAREMLGDDRILGVTAETPEQAVKAEQEGADYLGTRAVFYTSTKQYAAPPLGLCGLREIVQAVKIPVVAIGGINTDNARLVLSTGVCGIAVVSAIVAQPDVEGAARAMRAVIGRAG
ncbi:MAG: thiamine phosphate synthase [Candidatus Fermentithermobacillus carboniphilus]|uniref:Thiamine-phosphate synthase n=1 Tax=Candidatus Fermentithermobacillus carboniphilus TaxID=3085328 RepID=A0AAT9LBU8_9FIRM|nr:MAG: thiamine phosphate synthase [Candidatus Fermentithermobacillus carboniphilus]